MKSYVQKTAISFLFIFEFILSLSFLSIGFYIHHFDDLSFLYIALFACIFSLGSFGKDYLSSCLSERIVTALRFDLFSALISQDISFYDTLRPDTLIAQVTDHLTQIENFFSQSLARCLRIFFLFIGGGVFMAWLSPFLASISAIIFLCMIILMRLTSLSLKTIEHDRNILKAYLFGRWSEGLSEIKNIKAFHQEEFVENSFQIQNQKLFHLSLSGYFKTACLSSMVIFFVIVGGGVLFVLGLQEIQKNHLSTQDFLAFLFYLILVAATSGTLRNLILEWSQFLSSWHAITPHLEKKEPKKYSKKLFSPRGIIAFHKVHFSYNKEPLLKDITLSVTPGECLAIVGASGVGKTTLFSLILKFYQPQEGSIYMDGADISGICDEDVRKRIGWVSHNTPIFSGSVYENIMWGSEQSFSSQDIYGAAEQANALKFIENLPSGFQTQVGLGGVSLSFEERQRIAMARIILRNPYIFLFDEETNVLDPENEQAIQKSLHTLFSSRTSLVIAHRPSTILQAHRIAVLDGGRICGLGTHKELMQSHPLYPRLVNLEFGMAT